MSEKEKNERKHMCLEYRAKGTVCDECPIKNHALGDLCEDWCQILKNTPVYIKKKYKTLDSIQLEEIVAFVFENVLKNISDFVGESKFSTWASTIRNRCCYDYFKKFLKDKPNKKISIVPKGVQDICNQFPEDLYVRKSSIIGTLSVVKESPPEDVFYELSSLSQIGSWQDTIRRLKKKKITNIKKMPEIHPDSKSNPSKPYLDKVHFDGLCRKYKDCIKFKESTPTFLYILNPPMPEEIRNKLFHLSDDPTWKREITELYNETESWVNQGQLFLESVNGQDEKNEANNDVPKKAPTHRIDHSLNTSLSNLNKEIGQIEDEQSSQKNTVAGNITRAISQFTDGEYDESLKKGFEKLDPNCTSLFYDSMKYDKDNKFDYKSIVMGRAKLKGIRLVDDEIKKDCARLRQQYLRCIKKLKAILKNPIKSHNLGLAKG